jgi:hypothetical protein
MKFRRVELEVAASDVRTSRALDGKKAAGEAKR